MTAALQAACGYLPHRMDLSVALWREATAIFLRLALNEHLHWWWIERDRRLREELRHRGCPA